MITKVKFEQYRITGSLKTINPEDIIECKEYREISHDSFPSNQLTATIISDNCPFNITKPITFYAPKNNDPSDFEKHGVFYLDKFNSNGDGTYTVTMYDVSYKLNKFKTHGDFFCGQTFEQAIHNLLTWCGFNPKSTDGLSDCRDVYWGAIDLDNPYVNSKLYGYIPPDTSIKNAISMIAISLGLRIYVDYNGRIKFKPLSYRPSTLASIYNTDVCVGLKYTSADKVDFVEIKQDYDWTFDSTDYFMHKYHTNTMPNFVSNTNYEGHKYHGNYYWLPWMMYSFNGELRSKMNYSVWTGDDIPPRFSVDPSVTDCPSPVPSNMIAYYLKCLIDTPASSGLQPQVRNGIGIYKGCDTTSRITYPYTDVSQRWSNYVIKSYTQNIGLFKENMVDPEDGCDFYDYDHLAKDLYNWNNPNFIAMADVYYPDSYSVIDTGEFIKFPDEDGILQNAVIVSQNIDYSKSRDISLCKILGIKNISY